MKTGLVLTGGGARAAYQAGVLRGIAEILPPQAHPPFSILTGISAGAINGTFCASRIDDFKKCTQTLWDFWATLNTHQVFKSGSISLGRTGMRLLLQLGLGGFLKRANANHLLDFSPLGRLIRERIDFEAIRSHICSGRLHGVAVSATHYRSGTAVTFFEGAEGIPAWQRTSRLGLRSELQPEHVLASAAIPVFVEPVAVAGGFYGDGGIRLTAPLSPAIHLGAERVLAIGIRYRRSDSETLNLCQSPVPNSPTLADIAGVMLNAAFLDSLETDLERMRRINQTLEQLPTERLLQYPLRPIPVLSILPSRDLGDLAAERMSAFPPTIRHLLGGIGAQGKKGWDLVSYLAFDSAYSVPLLEMGYEDAMSRRNEILQFFSDPGAVAP